MGSGARQLLFDAVVEVAYDSAIKISEQLIPARIAWSVEILRNRFPFFLKGSDQAIMGIAQQLDVVARS